MAQHATVVYYSTYGNSPDAFFVANANNKRLQEAFNKHDIHAIKCITLESETIGSRNFRTIFTESDIKAYLGLMKVDF